MEHRRTSSPRLGHFVPQLPVEVCQLVDHMLAKDPLRRPQTPTELIDRLTRLELDAFYAWVA
jgi:hypothetical protein